MPSGAAAGAGARAPPHAAGSDLLAIHGVVAVEEEIWAPEFGLKGKVDCTIRAATKPSALQRWQGGDGLATKQPALVLPLELKTVAKEASSEKKDEHNAQVALYTLMLASRYGELASPNGIVLTVRGNPCL